MAPILVPLIIFLVLLVAWTLQRLLSPGGGKGGIRSVAIMRRSHLALSEARAKALVERALGDTPEILFIPMPPREDGAVMHAFVREGRAYGVICVPRPYVNPEAHEEIRATLTDAEVLTAMTTHGAWVSVDFMRGERDLGEINATICRVVAELIDDEAMLLYDVRHERVSKIDAKTKEILRGPAPMLIFGTDETTVSARAGDEALKVAEQEAQLRWPEFVSAWAQRTPDEKFAVKAAFHDGKRVEHMWVEMTEVGEMSVTGTIDNEPGYVRNLTCGQTVQLNVAQVEDWLIADPSGRIRGGFSVNTLMGKKLG